MVKRFNNNNPNAACEFPRLPTKPQLRPTNVPRLLRECKTQPRTKTFHNLLNWVLSVHAVVFLCVPGYQ